MRISVSNIAWSIAREPVLAETLRGMGIDRVDVAPSKYFPDPEAASADDVARVCDLWRNRGFAVEGAQSLLFGTRGLNLFDDSEGAMLRRLTAACRVVAGLGGRSVTFGSPHQRHPGNLPPDRMRRVAIDFFRRLGDAVSSTGVIVCVEAVPVVHGCTFLTRTMEAAELVEAVAHPAIRLQLDTGTMIANGEDPDAVIARCASLFGHAHVSEPGLVPLGETGARHGVFADAIRRHRPDLVVTVEMVEAPADRIVDAVALAIDCYGDGA
jgi:sugar phosphate isomerase/epimerase